MSHSKPDDLPSKSPSLKAPAINPVKFRRIAEELREGDGIDPREEQKRRLANRRRAKPDHAAERLGQEMKETLAVSLPDDSRLEGFAVGSVLSTGKGNCFVVQVYCTDPNRIFAPESIQKIHSPVANSIDSFLAAEKSSHQGNSKSLTPYFLHYSIR